MIIILSLRNKIVSRATLFFFAFDDLSYFQTSFKRHLLYNSKITSSTITFSFPFSWFLGFTFLDSFILLKNEFMYCVYLFIYCVFRKLIKLFLTNTEFVKIKIFISQIWTLFFLITTFLSYLQTLSNSWYCFSAILVWYFNSLPNGE